MDSTSPVVHNRSFPEAPRLTRTFLGLNTNELAILALYVAMLSFAVAFYQQSEDEGRAWILCQSFPLHELIFHILRYEGHPGLYYLLLWGLCHTGLPFTAVNWFFAAIGCGAIYVLLRFSPFPLYLRVLIPFGFVLGYQYAIEARSYVLFPLLGFSAVHLYRRVPVRPLAMAVVLALLANVSLHGTMVAIGFAVAYAVQLLPHMRGSLARPELVRKSWGGAGIFAISVLVVIFCVWPIKYMKLPLPVLGRRVARRLLGPISYNINSTQSKGAAGPSLRLGTFQAATASTPAAAAQSPYWSFLLSRFRFALTYPVATSSVLAFFYEGLIVLFLLLRRRLILLLPLVLLTYFLATVYVQVWHCGLIWVTLLLILWAAWDQEVKPTDRNLQNAVAGVLALLCIMQLPWTVGALRYQKEHATFPARAAAHYLKALPPSERIDGNELAFSVMAFFPHYIFLDHGAARFASRSGYPAALSIPDFVAEQPDVIMLRSVSVTADDRREFGNAGYTERHSFCGAPYFPNQPTVPICLSMFEKN